MATPLPREQWLVECQHLADTYAEAYAAQETDAMTDTILTEEDSALEMLQYEIGQLKERNALLIADSKKASDCIRDLSAQLDVERDRNKRLMRVLSRAPVKTIRKLGVRVRLDFDDI